MRIHIALLTAVALLAESANSVRMVDTDYDGIYKILGQIEVAGVEDLTDTELDTLIDYFQPADPKNLSQDDQDIIDSLKKVLPNPNVEDDTLRDEVETTVGKLDEKVQGKINQIIGYIDRMRDDGVGKVQAEVQAAGLKLDDKLRGKFETREGRLDEKVQGKVNQIKGYVNRTSGRVNFPCSTSFSTFDTVKAPMMVIPPTTGDGIPFFGIGPAIIPGKTGKMVSPRTRYQGVDKSICERLRWCKP